MNNMLVLTACFNINHNITLFYTSYIKFSTKFYFKLELIKIKCLTLFIF